MDNSPKKSLLYIATICMITFLMIPQVLSQTDQTVDLEKEPWKEPLPEGLYIKPYLQNVTQHSMVVMWETKTPVIGHVDYGTTKSFGSTISEKNPVTIHELEISELEPGTTYHYRARYGNITLDASTFKTAPAGGVENCRIIVYGDARSDPKRHRENIEQMLKLDGDIILHTGDIVASGTVYEQWQPQHFWPIQIISDKVPIFPALGNHERNSTHHFNYMSLPGNEVYYSFDYANVHIICLDSNSGSTPYVEGTPQYKWLIKDLEANQDAEWIFVFFHHPIFRCHPTRGVDVKRFTWHPIFEKYGVDLVLSGHDHYYFRSYPIGKVELTSKQGVVYLTSGGGGASLYPIRDRNYGAVSRRIHHITVLDIQGSRIEGRAIDYEGNEIDHFSMAHIPASSEEYISYEIFEIEKELRSQLDEIKPIVVEKSGDRVVVNTTLSIPTNFEIRIEGDIVWQESDNWTFTAQKTPFVINPGATLKIPVKAEAIYPNIYPIPKITLHFSKLIGRKEGFRNDELTFDAIKIQPLLPVTVRKVYTRITVDGVLDDSVWAAATKLSNFVTLQGDNRPTLLFSLDLNLQSGLDDGKISQALRDAFDENGFSLSQDVTLSIREKGHRWGISDKTNNRTYIVKKEGAELNIHHPTNGLTAMLAHDGEYLYAAARIEADARLVGDVLFSVDSTFASDLDELSVPEGLRWEFEENANSLSKDTTVSIRKEGKSWRIYDRDSKHSYAVKAATDGLNVSLDEGYTDRDNRRILDRDEHFAVSLSDGTNIYTFGVNPRGTQVDQNKSDRSWNLDWESGVSATGNGWIAEMSIPIVSAISMAAPLSRGAWGVP